MDYPSKLKVGGRFYEVRYESILKATSSVRIKKGAVVLKLSRYSRGKTRDEMVEKFLNWADKQLGKVSMTDFILPTYEDGGRIHTHNKVYELQVQVREGRVNSKLDGHLINISIPGDEISCVQHLVESVIMNDQLPYLREVLNEINQLYFQEKFNNVKFKRTSGRFGSCSSKRNINIAYRLLFAPREVFRYVCVHELAHLKEFNHSSRFWRHVADAMPDYKTQEKWLKNSGFVLG